jgi:hypothetical protein
MGRGAKKKGKFDDLDLEFKSNIENMTEEEIKRRISEVAIAEHENREAKSKDQDLADKVAAVKFASEQYREATKMNKLRIAYAHFILEARGKV